MKRQVFFISLVLLVGVAISFFLFVDRSSPDSSSVITSKQLPHKPLAYFDKGSVYLIDADDAVLVYQSEIDSSHVPSASFLSPDSITDDGRLFWYRSDTGILIHDINSKTTSLLTQPSAWFGLKPFFWHSPTTQEIWFIDNDGQTLDKVNYTSGQSQSISIPFPYGSFFVVSPDAKKVAFVEGYQQTNRFPQYLITTTDGLLIDRFSTLSEVAQRDWVAWSTDSQLLLGVEQNSFKTIFAFSDEAEGYSWITLTPGDVFTDFAWSGDYVLLTSSLYYYLFNTSTMQLARQIPVEMLAHLSGTTFISLSEQEFVLEEVFKNQDRITHRLWSGDWLGNLEIVVPAYGVQIVTTQVPGIEDGIESN